MRKQTVVLISFALVILNLAVGGYFMLRKGSTPSRPELTSPILAVAALTGKTVCYTAASREALRSQRPDLLNPAHERAFFQAGQNPAAWRQLDHQLHFDALLLSGDPGAYRPLLKHLLETRDWALTYLDQTSMIWKRMPVAAWKPEALDELKEKFPGEERAPFLVGAANKLLAVGMTQKAKAYLDEAIALDGHSADAWTQLALYDAQIGDWTNALAHCEKALAVDENYLPALSAKAQILFGAKRFNEALDLSARVIAADPRDPAALFLDAKIAHEAHAFQREISTMRSLVALAEQEGAPVSGYRIYLAQAYAANSDAQPAIDEFEKAAANPELSPEQRAFVEESIARIKSRTHPGSR